MAMMGGKSEWPQEAHPGRYHRPGAQSGGPCRQSAGPGRRATAPRTNPRRLSPYEKSVGGSSLHRQGTGVDRARTGMGSGGGSPSPTTTWDVGLAGNGDHPGNVGDLRASSGFSSLPRRLVVEDSQTPFPLDTSVDRPGATAY